MSVHDPGYRPSGWKVAGNHETRIRNLEAVKAGGSPMEFMALSEDFVSITVSAPTVPAMVVDFQSSGISYDIGTGIFTAVTPGMYKIDVVLTIVGNPIVFDTYVGFNTPQIHDNINTFGVAGQLTLVIATSGFRPDDDLNWHVDGVNTDLFESNVSIYGPFAAALP